MCVRSSSFDHVAVLCVGDAAAAAAGRIYSGDVVNGTGNS